jgi:hypothetical protein
MHWIILPMVTISCCSTLALKYWIRADVSVTTKKCTSLFTTSFKKAYDTGPRYSWVKIPEGQGGPGGERFYKIFYFYFLPPPPIFPVSGLICSLHLPCHSIHKFCGEQAKLSLLEFSPNNSRFFVTFIT